LRDELEAERGEPERGLRGLRHRVGRAARLEVGEADHAQSAGVRLAHAVEPGADAVRALEAGERREASGRDRLAQLAPRLREGELARRRARRLGEQIERRERLREAVAALDAREELERRDLLRPLLVGGDDDAEHRTVEAALARARQVEVTAEG